MPDLGKQYNPEATISAAPKPDNWEAPLPENGAYNQLDDFWQQYPHPVLKQLIVEAQEKAPAIASAAANMVQARANRVGAASQRLPSVQASAGMSRTQQQPSNTELLDDPFSQFGINDFGVFNNSPTNVKQVGLDMAWEMDLYGEKRAQVEAAKAQEKAAHAQWHEARIATAADVATSYFNYLACEDNLKLQTALESSYANSARITDIAFEAGLKNGGERAMMQSALMQARQRSENDKNQCDIEVKNLKLLTHMRETDLRAQLTRAAKSAQDAQKTSSIDMGSLFEIDHIPANVLRQRPDLYRAEADLIQAAANIKQAVANRLPSVRISGNIGWQSTENLSFKGSGQVWSLGPLELRLPIFDGGRLKAEQKSAEAAYEAQASRYRGVIQRAVYETELALVQLHDSHEQIKVATLGIQELRESFDLSVSREQAGFATKLEVEIAKRQWLDAQKNRLNLMQLQAQAWLNLYRAVGGGWQTEAQAASPALPDTPAAEPVVEPQPAKAATESGPTKIFSMLADTLSKLGL